MTASELIAELQKYDPHTPVFIEATTHFKSIKSAARMENFNIVLLSTNS